MVRVTLCDVCFCCCCFFLQAKDGIRVARESRVLGDVYKRQIQDGAVLRLGFARPERKNAITAAMYAALADGMQPVSYKHPTLPTIYHV